MKLPTTAVEIAKELLSFDTSKEEGITAGLEWLRDWSKKQHFHCTQFKDCKAILIETHPGVSPHFCFVTHLDVVTANDWEDAFQPKIENEFLVGRGAVDDKGSLAVCLETLLLSKELSCNISCLIVTDEETTNSDIIKVLKSGRFNPEFCIVADGGTHSQVDIGQKGILRLTATIKTEGGHSAFEEADKSAALRLLGFINQLNRIATDQPCVAPFKPTFINVSSLLAEAVPYGLPSLATAHLEIQFPLPQNSNFWMTTVNKLASTLNISIQIHWHSEPHLLKDEKVLRLLSNIPELRLITTGGNNLAKDICLAGIPAISHCPVEVYDAHCKGEKIRLADLEKGVNLYTNLVTLFKESQGT